MEYGTKGKKGLWFPNGTIVTFKVTYNVLHAIQEKLK